MYDLNKKFIFTHPPKCAGTSLEDLLGFLSLRNKNPEIDVFKHASLEVHLNELKNKNVNLEDFFKFSIIRNPWDRAVSYYNHIKFKAYESWLTEGNSKKEMPEHIKSARTLTFKQFIFRQVEANFNSEVSTKPYMFVQNEFDLDYVIRLEHLKEDFFEIKDKLGIDSDANIPHKNNSEIFLPRKPYAEYYDTETKELIEACFEWDIKTFKYKFE